jgi:hypothetical protein
MYRPLVPTSDYTLIGCQDAQNTQAFGHSKEIWATETVMVLFAGRQQEHDGLTLPNLRYCFIYHPPTLGY